MRLAAAVLETPDPGGPARFQQRLLGRSLRDWAACGVPPRAERVVGGRRVLLQLEPHEDVRVHADPDGHPFCPFVRTPPGGAGPSPL